MGLVVYRDQLFHGNVGVDLSSRKPRVTEQLLNVAEVSAAVQQMGGEGMSKRVRADVMNAGAKPNIFFHQTAH